APRKGGEGEHVEDQERHDQQRRDERRGTAAVPVWRQDDGIGHGVVPSRATSNGARRACQMAPPRTSTRPQRSRYFCSLSGPTIVSGRTSRSNSSPVSSSSSSADSRSVMPRLCAFLAIFAALS